MAELLSELKLRSGRSYEALAHRTGMSRSTVHRYCRGEIVPDSFGAIERIAKACGADRADLAELYRHWAQANAYPKPPPTPTGTGTEGPARSPSPTPTEAPSPDGMPMTPEPSVEAVGAGDAGTARGDHPESREASEPATPDPPLPVPAAHGRSARRHTRLRARHKLLLAISALAVVCAALITESTPATPRTSNEAVQWVSGPTWARPPAPVRRTLFGVTLNSATGTMPGFRVGAVRLWDSDTRWAQIQPQRGEFDWSVLDRQVAGANRAGLPVLFVLGGTPEWASPTGPTAPYPDGSRSAPPDDLADWDTFVRALVARYHGRIEAYELWVLGNDPRFFSGSVSTLVEMTRRASRIIREGDPRATVVCPGMGQLWTPEGQRVLRRFAESGGYRYCDVAGIKLYQRSASDPPETMLNLATSVDRLLHAAGVQPRLWSTGTTYTITLQAPLSESKARDYATRFFLVGLYARYLNLERMYFYNWGGTKLPIVLQAEGGAPTKAALAVEELQRWLSRAASRSCGHGMAIGVPENVWQCEFTVTERPRSHGAAISWTISGTATITAGPGARAVRHLDGSAVPIQPGDTVTITEEPVLIEYASTSKAPSS